MRPTPIPDAEVPEGAVRKVIFPPGNDLYNSQIATVEAVVSPLGRTQILQVRIVLEDGDLDKLAAGAPIWLTFMGAIVPFAIGLGLVSDD